MFNEGILKATMEVRNVNDNTGMDISIIDHFIVNEEGKLQVAEHSGMSHQSLVLLI